MYQAIAEPRSKIALEAERSLLRTLAYFDIFNHPLTLDELIRFSDEVCTSPQNLRSALCELVEKQIVVHRDGYYGWNDILSAIDLRKRDELRAKNRSDRAAQMSKRIAKFPFVRAVFISGSLSKGRLATDGDIDFFIITAPGRLWLTRTLLILYKKVFLFNSRKDFCVNYFIDTEHLEIPDRNRFTATETITLLPMCGQEVAQRFFDANRWAFDRFPNSRPNPCSVLDRDVSGPSRGWEILMNGRIGQWIDRLAMRLTWNFWKLKFSHMDPVAFEHAFRTRTYVSKHHPRNFQAFVLREFNERTMELGLART